MPMWKDAPAMIRDRPVAGFGGGSFVWTYPAYQRRPKYHLTYDFLHNEYLQMQVEYGAIGSGLLLAGLLWGGAGVALAVVRARSRAAAALLAGAAGAAAAACGTTAAGSGRSAPAAPPSRARRRAERRQARADPRRRGPARRRPPARRDGET